MSRIAKSTFLELITPILIATFSIIAGASPELSNSGDGDWQYSSEITIVENSGTNLTEYQVPMLLNGGNFPTNPRSDGADVRFSDMSGNELSYWIENWDYVDRSARIWVKVPKIPAKDEVKLLMYYGNPSATSKSDGAATFDFFDDFEEKRLDEIKWYINYGAPSVSDGVLSLSGESVISERVRAFGDNYIFESRSKISDTGKEPRSFLRSTNDYTVLDGSDRFEYGSWTGINEMQLANLNNDIFNSVTNREKFPTSFEVLGIARLTAKTEAIRQYAFKLRNEKNTPDTPLYMQLYSWGGETYYVDWARVRKYSPQEPTIIMSSPEGRESPPKSASVSLYGEKTDVILGEDILLKLSAVNLITQPLMHVQVILIPPSGMSVISSEFSMATAGQFAASYELEPGSGRDIEVRIRSNQVGDFNVNGRIIYYFGDEKEKAEYRNLNLPIKVREEPAELDQASIKSEQKEIPGFGAIIAMISLFLILFFKRIADRNANSCYQMSSKYKKESKKW